MITARIALVLLVPLLARFGCQAPQQGEPGAGEPNTTSQALAVLRGVGDAVIRVEGTAALIKYAPEAMAILDTSGRLLVNPDGSPVLDTNGKQMQGPDGVVSLAEIEAIVRLNDPTSITYVAIMALEIYRAKNKR